VAFELRTVAELDRAAAELEKAQRPVRAARGWNASSAALRDDFVFKTRPETPSSL